jgi:GMP synthase-like glutamine amidotransferase
MRIHFIQHVHFESPGYLLEWATAQQHTISFTKIYESVTFPAADTMDLLVVMGGPMGVYEEDKYAWLTAEKAFIKAVIAAGTKVLGICLGAQLIAEVSGAKVYPNTEKEIGWWPIQKIINEKTLPLTASLPDEFMTFHWHGDTFDLPPGAVHLFATRVCHHQGFLLNEQVAGLQFHMEATPALVEQMATHGQDELVTAPHIQSAQQMQEQSARYAASQQKQLETFVKQFLDL